MGLDIWFKEDIANALIAADEASSATAAALSEVTNDPGRLRAYREGYRAALTTLALAFGISPLALMTAPEEERLRPEAFGVEPQANAQLEGAITYLPARMIAKK
ncbi:MAG: hypothetical protein ACETWB_00160 [Anaerolineae bacterium]